VCTIRPRGRCLKSMVAPGSSAKDVIPCLLALCAILVQTRKMRNWKAVLPATPAQGLPATMTESRRSSCATPAQVRIFFTVTLFRKFDSDILQARSNEAPTRGCFLLWLLEVRYYYYYSYYLCSPEERTSQLQLNCVLLLGDDGDLDDGPASVDAQD